MIESVPSVHYIFAFPLKAPSQGVPPELKSISKPVVLEVTVVKVESQKFAELTNLQVALVRVVVHKPVMVKKSLNVCVMDFVG